MRNAEEHKKFLAQIKELESNSINYFDVKKEFFLIDSNNLHQVRPHLYGYSIQAGGIYEDDNLTPEAIKNLDGRGCYVYVDVHDGKITIKQDINGCWGIYLFRHGDYFALSSSFFRLLDHIKFKYPLTVNRDYCHAYITDAVCSHAYMETAVNEIHLTDKNSVIQIDIAKKGFEIELIDYNEHTILPDTQEGLAVLDRWVEFWSGILRGISQHTKFITATLSGGFDTRISFIPLLYSGIDLNAMKIISAKDAGYTHVEDFKIASEIANHYGFKLNQPLSGEELNFSLIDTLNVDLYCKQTFHAIPAVDYAVKNVDKIYSLNGGGGELIRGNWLRFKSQEEFMNSRLKQTKKYSLRISKEMFHSLKNTLGSSLSAVSDKHNIDNSHSVYIQQYLYHDVRARNHFGKANAVSYLKGKVSLMPVFDPEIQTLRFDSPQCPSYQLLISLIFTRYQPDLLKFPFQGNRSIAPETIEYAKKINERFPYVKNDKSDISGGGFFVCRRVINMRKKFLLLVAITKNFRLICRKIA